MTSTKRSRREGRKTRHDFDAIVIPAASVDAAYGSSPILPPSEQGAVPSVEIGGPEDDTVELDVNVDVQWEVPADMEVAS